MQKNKLRFILLLVFAFMIIVTGCSGDKTLLDENGKEVTLENKDKPSLVFFFTGNT